MSAAVQIVESLLEDEIDPKEFVGPADPRVALEQIGDNIWYVRDAATNYHIGTLFYERSDFVPNAYFWKAMSFKRGKNEHTFIAKEQAVEWLIAD